MHRRILGGGARDTRKNTPRIGDLVMLKVVFHAERPRAKNFQMLSFKFKLSLNRRCSMNRKKQEEGREGEGSGVKSDERGHGEGGRRLSRTYKSVEKGVSASGRIRGIRELRKLRRGEMEWKKGLLVRGGIELKMVTYMCCQ